MGKSARLEFWLQRVRAFDRSGLTRSAWCARHGVAVSTLDYWRCRIGKAAVSRSLVPIVVDEAVAAGDAQTPGVIEVQVLGLRLRADAGVDATWLCHVLRGLR